ncbi:unnamed protein product [Mycena citricolor]|uniref:Uncharacterized protein n=1 Tax=Mycena citricolor TaxID=2018698 RepID=A0AAD2HA26_9AGAR|nr:unnamed protein product [Mycena citricolor]
MSSSLRSSTLRSCLRRSPAFASQKTGTRTLTTSRVLREEAAPNVGAPIRQKKPIGAVRGSIVGFLAGFSLAASLAAYNLLDEYNMASAALQASVDELKLSTEKITAHVRRIEAVEKDLKALADTTASKENLSSLRGEMKKLYDGLNVEYLGLRANVWGIQQDVHALSKKDTTSVRI